MNSHTSEPTIARLAAAALTVAALLAIAGFTALASVFEYPQILQEPTDAILDLFRQRQGVIMGWFTVLMVSAAMLAPAGVWLGRLVGGASGRAIAATGIAAAVVQVLGLQRWVTLVPAISRQALDPGRHAQAVHRFDLLHTVLGTIIGETLGYALTATFTLLVVRALPRSVVPRWLAIVGYAAAVLIATGIVVPLIPVASLTNFVGYVLWCIWVLALAVMLVLRTTRAPDLGPVEPSPR